MKFVMPGKLYLRCFNKVYNEVNLTFSEKFRDFFKQRVSLCVFQKAISDKEAAVLVGKNERLEKLCRALQAERNQKTNGASAGNFIIIVIIIFIWISSSPTIQSSSLYHY